MKAIPVRLQLSRAKGFNLQSHSRAVNGLDAVKVARPTIWGNPFVIGEASGVFAADDKFPAETMIPALTRTDVMRLYRDLVNGFICPEMFPHGHNWNTRFKKMTDGAHASEMAELYLKAKNLGCFCHLCPTHKEKGKPLGVVCAECDPCHVDVLLEVANR